jgi:hypothetical protein
MYLIIRSHQTASAFLHLLRLFHSPSPEATDRLLVHDLQVTGQLISGTMWKAIDHYDLVT